MLIPSPIAESHDELLRRYLMTGSGTIVDYTRVVFGVHRVSMKYAYHNCSYCHVDIVLFLLSGGAHLPYAACGP